MLFAHIHDALLQPEERLTGSDKEAIVLYSPFQERGAGLCQLSFRIICRIHYALNAMLGQLPRDLSFEVLRRLSR